MENTRNMEKLQLKWGKCIVNITTNEPEIVKRDYSEQFGPLNKITSGFKEIVDFITNNNKDKNLKIVLNSMISIK